MSVLIDILVMYMQSCIAVTSASICQLLNSQPIVVFLFSVVHMTIRSGKTGQKRIIELNGHCKAYHEM